MKEGVLVYDERQDRIDIRFGLEEYYGGLHCGQCFDILVNGEWKPTSIEKAEDWYLVGFSKVDPLGLRARI
jgi:hypothetical protein